MNANYVTNIILWLQYVIIFKIFSFNIGNNILSNEEQSQNQDHKT
jgi:hypothetical protein